MSLRFKDSIGVRFLRIVFGAYLFVTILITSTQLYVEYNQVEKNMVTELADVASSFEDGLAKALWNLDNDSIEFIIAGIQKIEVIKGVKVVGLQNDLQGANGVFVYDDSEYSQIGVATSGEYQAKELHIRGMYSGNYYEHTMGIMFKESDDTRPELIGFLSLYSDHQTVIQRFKRSFFLILIIALLKTFALWFIFLYFARRIVAKPLTELTAATQELQQSDKNHQQKPANLQQLETIASGKNRDEIQLLARGFLDMQKVILEKLDNLYSLNEFAIQLSKAASSARVFEHVNQLFTNMFGCKFSVIFKNREEIFWSSLPKDELDGLTVHEFSDENGTFSSQFADRSITYLHDGASFPSDTSDPNWTSNIPMLSLPITATGFEGKQIRFFGALHRDRLTEELMLTRETKSFLQVVAAMVGNTLTSIHQREVIEGQNQFLEERVAERTRELAQVNAELKHLAVHDPLTELPNRTLFNDRLEQLIHMSKREGRGFAVASIDLTKFKLINDNYGHDAGDTVLIEVGRRFSKALRATDTLARMGGDEFAAILTDTIQPDSINKILKQMIGSLEDPIVLIDNAHIIAGANIGVAIYPNHAQTTEQLFKYADIAMYQAKREGRNYGIFDVEKNTEEKEFVQLMSELDMAIARGQLILHYQPLVDVNTRQVIAYEALVRWMHPVKGLIPPNMFIPHAEKSRLITPLTQWVLRKSCEQAAKFKVAGREVPISVNLSPRVFTSPDLPNILERMTRDLGLKPELIKLEITEGAAMANPDQAVEILGTFAKIGFPISIDDFGTGHSSLAYLTRLPVSELKIDKSFLANDTANNRVIIETIIELAHALDLTVVAEGIETEASHELLVEKGCDIAQGFHYARPVDSESAIELLLKDHL